MTRIPATRVDPDWLALRGPADTRARTANTMLLVRRLADHLAASGPVSGPARLVDVGAGTGAGAGWLRARLPLAQQWRLVDPDPDLVTTAVGPADGWARAIVAGVAELPALLVEEPADAVTCQALLDILTQPEVDTLLSAAAGSRAALLLSLSVTGEVDLTPPHPEDALVGEAFNAHQHRGRRLGPDAGGYAEEVLARSGYDVTTAASPWRLGTTDRDLLRSWLRGRAEAAAEQRPKLADRFRQWLHDREAAVDAGGLHAVVGHLDVLAIPQS